MNPEQLMSLTRRKYNPFLRGSDSLAKEEDKKVEIKVVNPTGVRLTDNPLGSLYTFKIGDLLSAFNAGRS